MYPKKRFLEILIFSGYNQVRQYTHHPSIACVRKKLLLRRLIKSPPKIPRADAMYKRKRSQKGRSGKRRRVGFAGNPSYYLVPGARRSAASHRSGQSRTTTALFRSLPNMPDTVGIKIRTYVQLTWNCVAGAVVAAKFALNDIKNPFGASSTHTNPTINNLALLYGTAVVTAAALEFKWSPDSGNGNVSGMWGMYATPSSLAPTLTGSNVNIVEESSRCVWNPLPTIGGFGGKSTFRKYFNMASIVGVSTAEYQANHLHQNYVTGTSWASSPGELILASCYFQSNDLTNNCKYFSHIVLTQYVVLQSRQLA